MDFGYIVSINLTNLTEDERYKLKELQEDSKLSLISFINQQKKNSFIKKIIQKILNKNSDYLLDIIISDTDELSNYDMEILGLENLELLTYIINDEKMDLYQFLHEYQCNDNNNCDRFYLKIYSLGAKFTKENFYNFCHFGSDKKLVDFYVNNIITNIETSKLNIDNHIIMKRIIELKKYDRTTIDKIYKLHKEHPDSVAFCYNELLKNGYTFNNNYILLTIFVEAIYYNKNLLKHPEFSKYIDNKIFKINITNDDLVKCLSYGESINTMIENIQDFNEILNKKQYYNKYYNKAEIVYLV